MKVWCSLTSVKIASWMANLQRAQQLQSKWSSTQAWGQRSCASKENGEGAQQHTTHKFPQPLQAGCTWAALEPMHLWADL